MQIDVEKIKELYGDSINQLLNENQYQNFEKNILYLYKKEIKYIQDIVESYYLIFLYEHNDFKEKVDNLIDNLGKNYVEILSKDMSLWENLL